MTSFFLPLFKLRKLLVLLLWSFPFLHFHYSHLLKLLVVGFRFLLNFLLCIFLSPFLHLVLGWGDEISLTLSYGTFEFFYFAKEHFNFLTIGMFFFIACCICFVALASSWISLQKLIRPFIKMFFYFLNYLCFL